MRYQPLRELASIVTERAFAHQIGPEEIFGVSVGDFIPDTGRVGPLKLAPNYEGTAFRAQDVLCVPTTSRLRKVWLADRNGVAKPDDILVLRPSGNVAPSFLAAMLRSQPFGHAIARASALTPSEAVDFGLLGRLDIPTPESRAQQNIVRFYEVVESLRQLYDALLTEHDALEESVFEHVFREQSARSRSCLLSELVDGVDSGWNIEAFPRLARSNEWRILGADAVSDGLCDVTKAKYLRPELNPPVEFRLSKGDLIVTPWSSAGRVERPALISVDDPKLLFSERLWRIRPRVGILPGFLKGLLGTKATTRKLGRLTRRRGATGTIAKADLLSLEVFEPSAWARQRFEVWLWEQDAARMPYKQQQADLVRLCNAFERSLYTAGSSEEFHEVTDWLRPALSGPREVVRHFSTWQLQIWHALRMASTPFTMTSLRHVLGQDGANTPTETTILQALELFEALGIVHASQGRLSDEWRLARDGGFEG